MWLATQSTMVVILVACVIVTAEVDATAINDDPILEGIHNWIGWEAWCRKDNGTLCHTALVLPNKHDPDHGWCRSKFEDLVKLLVREGAKVNRSCNVELIFTVEFCTNTLRALEQHCTNAKQSTVSTKPVKSLIMEEPTTTTETTMTTTTEELRLTVSAYVDSTSSPQVYLTSPTHRFSTYVIPPENLTTIAPGNVEENSSCGTSNLYWILPVAGFLLIMLIALPVGGFYFHKKAGYKGNDNDVIDLDYVRFIPSE